MKTLLIPLLLTAGCGYADAQIAPGLFGWFSDLVGSCWVGKFPDGKTQHTQCYTTQFGTFIRGTAELHVEKDGQLQVQFQGDSVFAKGGDDKRIVYMIWGSSGNHDRLEAEYVGDELVFPVPSKADPRKVSFRSVWRRLSPTSFEVRRERPGASGWDTDLRVVYTKSSASPKALQ